MYSSFRNLMVQMEQYVIYTNRENQYIRIQNWPLPVSSYHPPSRQGISYLKVLGHVLKAAFTRYELDRASKVPGMSDKGKLDRLDFEASCNFHYSTCMKRLRAHPRHLTRASILIA
jgi:hypothetical protein